jgi:hypothetical protein
MRPVHVILLVEKVHTRASRKRTTRRTRKRMILTALAGTRIK